MNTHTYLHTYTHTHTHTHVKTFYVYAYVKNEVLKAYDLLIYKFLAFVSFYKLYIYVTQNGSLNKLVGGYIFFFCMLIIFTTLL